MLNDKLLDIKKKIAVLNDDIDEALAMLNAPPVNPPTPSPSTDPLIVGQITFEPIEWLNEEHTALVVDPTELFAGGFIAQNNSRHIHNFPAILLSKPVVRKISTPEWIKDDHSPRADMYSFYAWASFTKRFTSAVWSLYYDGDWKLAFVAGRRTKTQGKLQTPPILHNNDPSFNKVDPMYGKHGDLYLPPMSELNGLIGHGEAFQHQCVPWLRKYPTLTIICGHGNNEEEVSQGILML